ncbi:MAG: hypothetical protein AMXMBFR82_15880 [Candidatus Hydrogenedentota bacterium]
MLTAHVPAGYILSRAALSSGLLPATLSPRLVIASGVFAAILPDLDMIYFYTIDARQHLHHSYWTHIPLFWVGVCLVVVAVLYAIRQAKYAPLVVLAAANLLVHCFLDTVVAGILWHKPFLHKYTVFVEVPNVYPYTFMNFVLHWTFIFEVLIWIVALGLFLGGSRGFLRRRTPTSSLPEMG